MLVVDDEVAVRRGTKRILEKMGFDVVTAGDGAEALRIFHARDGAFDLVVLDMGMPIMGGRECFAGLREHSRVPILIATGYAVDSDAQALVAAGAEIIEKPFRSEDLTREVTRILQSTASGSPRHRTSSSINLVPPSR
jgi:DNA-binding response OmpR family regulator